MIDGLVQEKEEEIEYLQKQCEEEESEMKVLEKDYLKELYDKGDMEKLIEQQQKYFNMIYGKKISASYTQQLQKEVDKEIECQAYNEYLEYVGWIQEMESIDEQCEVIDFQQTRVKKDELVQRMKSIQLQMESVVVQEEEVIREIDFIQKKYREQNI